MRECGSYRGPSTAFGRLRVLFSLRMTVRGNYWEGSLTSSQYCHAERRRAVFARRSRRTARAKLVFALLLALVLAACSTKPDPNTLVMIIESSPLNLDPRVGIDAPSERIDNLIFDDLLSRGDDLDVAPGLAERWD